MKEYVFIIPSICNIGGAQFYLVNKMHYLQDKGWNVNVIYARKDILFIKELEIFLNNNYPFLDYSTMYFKNSYVKSKAKKIADFIKKEGVENIVIESCTVSISTWAELVAKELQCKHICFAFEELFEMSQSQLGFAYFKHQRHELAGIRPESVPLMFKGSKYVINNPEHYRACSIPTIDDVDSPYINYIKKYDIVLGSLGRLDKGFVPEALKQMVNYIDNHPNKSYAVLLIGDTKDIVFKKQINRLFEGKADLYITGEVWPVSRKLINMVDVFVSSSGAAVATAVENIPTIAISPETFLPNGILNFTTKFNIMAPKPSDKSTAKLIEDIIDKKFCETHRNLSMYENYWEKKKNNDWDEFDRQILIAEDNKTKEYYDVLNIKLEGKRKIASVYGKIFGFKIFHNTIIILQYYFGKFIKG